jgi:hypothetical protein
MTALARCFRPGGRAPRPEAHVETAQPAIRLPRGSARVTSPRWLSAATRNIRGWTRRS